MTKKSKNTINFNPFIWLCVIIVLWQILSYVGVIDNFLLPSPTDIMLAFIKDFNTIIKHSVYSITESLLGLFLSIVIGFLIALLMDMNEFLYKSLYPILIVTQTIPVVAIAPLLVLWFGFGIFPKILLIVIICFFPITVSILDGFKIVDEDELNLLKSMGAKKFQIYQHEKIPTALVSFFSGLKIAVSYFLVGAVISEWLGGNNGLGVYMTRVRKSFSYDKMFAVIFLITLISLVFVALVNILEKRLITWKNIK